jgi:hypothetical protein
MHIIGSPLLFRRGTMNSTRTSRMKDTSIKEICLIIKLKCKTERKWWVLTSIFKRQLKKEDSRARRRLPRPSLIRKAYNITKIWQI